MSPQTHSEVVVLDRVSHSYPPTRKQRVERKALRDVSITIAKGEIFALLGPNGSGKSTLFRILSTLLKPTSGTIHMFGNNLLDAPDAVRHLLGVVFQNPSLDKKLTVRENLLHQGHLYGLRGEHLRGRIHDTLSQVGILDRANDLVESLSGGMQRRTELAKCLLHNPPILLLDEPSTGLDPGARRDFTGYLQELRRAFGVTVLLTTHILDEAEHCDRLAILDQGSLVALGTPQELKNEIGGDVISMTSGNPTELAAIVQERFNAVPQVVGSTVRVERSRGHEFIPQLVEAFPGKIETVTLSKPSLEDVFIHKTGRTFWDQRTTEN